MDQVWKDPNRGSIHIQGVNMTPSSSNPLEDQRRYRRDICRTRCDLTDEDMVVRKLEADVLHQRRFLSDDLTPIAKTFIFLVNSTLLRFLSPN
jgi:hypothetical protein